MVYLIDWCLHMQLLTGKFVENQILFTFTVMKPNILIIYYSQSGQLSDILHNLAQPLMTQAEVEFAEIKPARPFPFPWTTETFFDCMPECVLQIPEAIEPLQFSRDHYDLIILGYQPWFLSPSLPISSFLQSPYAGILRESRVLTVIGARNMWLHAQEGIKERLLKLEATLVGNIVLVDRHPNLTSLLTVIRWSFKGQKEAGKFLPEAGVSKHDIRDSARFGKTIAGHLQQPEGLHEALLKEGSIELNPALIVLEHRAVPNFRKFAAYIRARGERGNPERRARVKLFRRLLFVGVFILSPISSLTAQLSLWLNRGKIRNEVDYFLGISHKENAF